MNKHCLFFPLFIILLSSFKAPLTEPTDEAKTTFNKTFKDAKNVQWAVSDNTYSAHFTTDNVIETITYDKGGKFIRSRRCFGEEMLPSNVLASVKTQYTGKTIRLITEVVEGNELLYSLTIDDEVNCWIVAADTSGNTEVLSKFKKQQ